jgi:hypothetical protein
MSSGNKTTRTAEKPQTKSAPPSDSLDEKADKIERTKKPQAPQKLPDYEEDDEEEEEEEDYIPEPQLPARRGKRRMVPVHQSRIADRPVNNKASTMNIKIE